MAVRFISDLHLNDACMFGWRSIELSVRDYSDMIADNWNQTVSDNDMTIVVGDIGICCQNTIDVLHGLKGQKILVMGNHDVEWGNTLYEARIFENICRYILTQEILITHVPVEGNEPSLQEIQYQVHGHHHEYNSLSMRSRLETYARDARRLNCCADLNGMRPRTLSELMMFKALLVERV